MRYFFRRHHADVTTSIEADQIFWSGSSIVFMHQGNTIAAICLMPGDVVIREGAWHDLDKVEWEELERKIEAGKMAQSSATQQANREPDPLAKEEKKVVN